MWSLIGGEVRASGVAVFIMSEAVMFPLDMGANSRLAEFVCAADKNAPKKPIIQIISWT